MQARSHCSSDVPRSTVTPSIALLDSSMSDGVPDTTLFVSSDQTDADVSLHLTAASILDKDPLINHPNDMEERSATFTSKDCDWEVEWEDSEDGCTEDLRNWFESDSSRWRRVP